MGEGWSDFQSLMVHAQAADSLDCATRSAATWRTLCARDAQPALQHEPAQHHLQPHVRRHRGQRRRGALGRRDHVRTPCSRCTAASSPGWGSRSGLERSMQLFIDGLKLSPANPTFLDYPQRSAPGGPQPFCGRGRERHLDRLCVAAGWASRRPRRAATTRRLTRHSDTPTLTFSISGTVTQNGAGLAGVTVTAGGKTATTAADGAYSITGLAAGRLHRRAEQGRLYLHPVIYRSRSPPPTRSTSTSRPRRSPAPSASAAPSPRTAPGLVGVTVERGRQDGHHPEHRRLYDLRPGGRRLYGDPQQGRVHLHPGQQARSPSPPPTLAGINFTASGDQPAPSASAAPSPQNGVGLVGVTVSAGGRRPPR